MTLQLVRKHPIGMLQLQRFLLRLLEGPLIPKQLRTFLFHSIILQGGVGGGLQTALDVDMDWQFGIQLRKWGQLFLYTGVWSFHRRLRFICAPFYLLLHQLGLTLYQTEFLHSFLDLGCQLVPHIPQTCAGDLRRKGLITYIHFIIIITNYICTIHTQ